MTTYEKYNKIVKNVANLSKEQVLCQYNCFNVDDELADCQIDDCMVITFIWNGNTTFVAENVDLIVNNEQKPYRSPFNFNDYFTLNELSFIEHILDRMTDDNDLKNCFTHFSRFEVRDFINKCQQCSDRELSYNNFDVLINTYLDKSYINESLEYIKNNLTTLSLEQQFDYVCNIRKQLDMLLENKV